MLDEHLQQMGIIPETIAGYEHLAASHMSVAACVSKGEADLGIGTEKTAWNVSGVEFVPLQMIGSRMIRFHVPRGELL